VTDPAHCVEGAATVRGLVFYVEAEKEAAAAAAALATRAAGWKKGSDGNDLGIPNNDFLALLLRLIETYVSVAAEERITIALWILHTHSTSHRGSWSSARSKIAGRRRCCG